MLYEIARARTGATGHLVVKGDSRNQQYGDKNGGEKRLLQLSCHCFFYHFSKHFVFTRSDDEIDAKENEAGKGSKTHQGNEKTENYALKNHADTLVMARLQSQRHQNAQTTKFE